MDFSSGQRRNIEKVVVETVGSYGRLRLWHVTNPVRVTSTGTMHNAVPGWKREKLAQDIYCGSTIYEVYRGNNRLPIAHNLYTHEIVDKFE